MCAYIVGNYELFNIKYSKNFINYTENNIDRFEIPVHKPII